MCGVALNLGRSKTAQYSACDIVKAKCAAVSNEKFAASGKAFALLCSDVLLIDDNAGFSVDAAYLARALGVEKTAVDTAHSSLRYKTVMGFISVGRYKRSHIRAFEKVSVLCFNTKKILPEYLTIGERQNEGFGSVRICTENELLKLGKAMPDGEAGNGEDIKNGILFELIDRNKEREERRLQALKYADEQYENVKGTFNAAFVGRLLLMVGQAADEADLDKRVATIKNESKRTKAKSFIDNAAKLCGGDRREFLKIALTVIKYRLSENTDCDLLLDSRGKPYIPATSIAGVLASRLSSDDKERLYGKISPKGDSEKSHVIYYDAEYVENGEPVISVRDSVALENKVGVDGAKFDFEAVEPGARFRAYMELDDSVSSADEELMKAQLAALDCGILRFGHKTTRGCGQVRLENVVRWRFTEVGEWLRFDMYDKNCLTEADTVKLSKTENDTDIIELDLILKGALSIRSYTTEAAKEGEPAPPDYKYLSLRNGKPVIPGTTWAGVFRDSVARLLGVNKMTDKAMRELFGYVEQGTKKTQKSRITFSESLFIDGSYEKKLITRNSIDRFSAATNDGALYTELTVYNGKTSLTVSLPKDTDTVLKTALLAAFADLDNGFTAVGGLTAVGHGLFEIESFIINGKDMTERFKAYDFKGFFGGEQN